MNERLCSPASTRSAKRDMILLIWSDLDLRTGAPILVCSSPRWIARVCLKRYVARWHTRCLGTSCVYLVSSFAIVTAFQASFAAAHVKLNAILEIIAPDMPMGTWLAMKTMRVKMVLIGMIGLFSAIAYKSLDAMLKVITSVMAMLAWLV